MSAVGDRARAVRRRISVVDPVSRWWGRLPWWAKALIALAGLAFAVLYPRTLSSYWQSILFFPVGIYIAQSNLNKVLQAQGGDESGAGGALGEGSAVGRPSSSKSPVSSR